MSASQNSASPKLSTPSIWKARKANCDTVSRAPDRGVPVAQAGADRQPNGSGPRGGGLELTQNIKNQPQTGTASAQKAKTEQMALYSLARTAAQMMK